MKKNYEINKNKIYFITGSAGFIGFHLSKRLLEMGCNVIGIDNLNSYYDVNLKKSRNKILQHYKNYQFFLGDITNKEVLEDIFDNNCIDIVVNLAAQAGVRYSITNPDVYIESNIVGFLNVIEMARHYNIKHFLYASSSSVYGMNEKLPFSVKDNVDHPISLYAATKKSNELIAHVYSHLYKLPTTGLRFFTVYGPWGRPDMALFLFTDAILNNREINVFNNGNMKRDFTYIDDIIESIVRLLNKPPVLKTEWKKEMLNAGTSSAPYKVYNIGNNNPVILMDFIKAIENKIGKTALKKYMPLQDGDVPETYAEVNDLINDIDFKPQTDIQSGVNCFFDWYKEYYHIDIS